MEDSDKPREFVVFPVEAIKYLPEDWQKHLYALNEEARGVLETADENLKIIKSHCPFLPNYG